MAVYGVINKRIDGSYWLGMVGWDPLLKCINTKEVVGPNRVIREAVVSNNCIIVNCTIQSSGQIYKRRYKTESHKISSVAKVVRKELEKDAWGNGESMSNRDTEASRILSELYEYLGFRSRIVNGWCKYDETPANGTRPYSWHTWVEILLNGSKTIYIDITADQFNRYMSHGNKYQSLILTTWGLPHGMSYKEPVA